MGYCSSCNTVLNSTEEAAQTLGVSDSRVRGVLARRPGRLRGSKVGWSWIVPVKGVEKFDRQPNGLHLAPGADGREPGAPVCPGCGERLLSPKQAAGELQVSVSRVHAILARHPERLRAFRVGHRWVIPKSGVEVYRDRQRMFGVLKGNGGSEKGAAGAGNVEDWGDRAPVTVEVVVKPEVCHCGAYPFPHRKGGGRCK
jgi:hypothetical protein